MISCPLFGDFDTAQITKVLQWYRILRQINHVLYTCLNYSSILLFFEIKALISMLFNTSSCKPKYLTPMKVDAKSHNEHAKDKVSR